MEGGRTMFEGHGKDFKVNFKKFLSKMGGEERTGLKNRGRGIKTNKKDKIENGRDKSG